MNNLLLITSLQLTEMYCFRVLITTNNVQYPKHILVQILEEYSPHLTNIRTKKSVYIICLIAIQVFKLRKLQVKLEMTLWLKQNV